MKNLVLLIGALLLTTNLAWAQCAIQTSTNNVCLGNSVSFSRSPASAQDSAFLWDFGDGSSSTQAGTTYQYTAAGVYTINLKIYKIGGSVCVAPPIKIRVFPKPIAQFTVNDKSQCFDYNNFVFTDLSGPGASNAPIKRRTFLYGDGAFINQAKPYSNAASHVYFNASAGGNYNVTLEVEDTNGCLNQYFDTVSVFPTTEANFAVEPIPRCGSTEVIFDDRSILGSNSSAQYWWFFGDGTTATGKLGIKHTYYGDTTFYPKLVIEDGNGCRDTLQTNSPIVSIIPDTLIRISTSRERCFNGNKFSFTNNTRLAVDNAFYWFISDSFGNFSVDSNQRQMREVVFSNCGVYNVKLFFNYNGCSFTNDTQVVVYGPRVILSTPNSPILNKFQCMPHDTVWFHQTDYSCYYKNNTITYLWDFDDDFAPNCTTDTKNNINVGVNCRYSRDSTNLFHVYTQPNKDCYTVSLFATDSEKNCVDATRAFMALAPPKIGYDYSVVPPEARAYADLVRCSDIPIMVYWPGVEPRCYPESVWILPDSSCAIKEWIRADSNAQNKQFAIDRKLICTKDTVVYFGIVVRNGRDALGNYCYDTAYYPYINSGLFSSIPFQFSLQDSDLCAPHRLIVKPVDSINYRIGRIEYWFSTENDPFIVEKLPGDSIIKPFFYQTNASGVVEVMVRYFSYDGCSLQQNYSLKLGFDVGLVINTPTVCRGSKASISARVRYYSDTTLAYWSKTSRAQQGLETLYWNFGDSTAWFEGTEQVAHTYQKQGVFNIKIAIKDSTGCFDTLQNSLFNVVVTSVKANPTALQDTFYCAPAIVSFYDSSFVTYGNGLPQFGYITSRIWEFGANKGSSVLTNPGVFYDENGTHYASLGVLSSFGCYDTAIKKIIVLGPQPRFVIVDDTFGCVPFTVKLKNTTNFKLRNWIWQFNDASNTILATDRDTNIHFTYYTPGIYKIDLLGEDRIYNPTTGSFKTCAQSFPFLENSTVFHPRQVVVLAYDSLKISAPDTVCVFKPFNVSGTGTNQIGSVIWDWGDETPDDQTLITNTAIHTYDSSGSYLLAAKPFITHKSQCVAPASKVVFAQAPEANFTFDFNTYPDVRFQNTSVNGKRFLWDFNDLASSNNISVEINPTHRFTDGDTLFKVCLSTFDESDCMDSVCKNIILNARVKIPNVFTPGNNDQKNDAFDIDIEGFDKYELYIYNRWGSLVYESLKDGIGNDGINWNGKDKNSGDDCPEGVYYVVFKYKLYTNVAPQVYHGTVTLIRD